jgi:hypothetical protein
MPPVVPRKALEETQRNAILSEHQILSNATWSAREDLDREDEQANMEEDPTEPLSIGIMGPEGEDADDDTAANDPSNQKEGERVS